MVLLVLIDVIKLNRLLEFDDEISKASIITESHLTTGREWKSIQLVSSSIHRSAVSKYRKSIESWETVSAWTVSGEQYTMHMCFIEKFAMHPVLNWFVIGCEKCTPTISNVNNSVHIQRNTYTVHIR